MNEESRNEPSGALGKAIRVRRTELDLKRRDLADRAGLSYPYISEIENGVKHPSDHALAVIAAALEMAVSDLARLREHYAEQPTPWHDKAAWGQPASIQTNPAPAVPSRLRPAAGGSLELDAADVEKLARNLVDIELERWKREVLPGVIDSEVNRVLADRETRE